MSCFTVYSLELFPSAVTGLAVQPISLKVSGRVSYRASSWPARLYQVKKDCLVYSGQAVKIVGREGITLLIQPLQADVDLNE